MIEMTADNQFEIASNESASGELVLGVEGFTYPDLYKPERLKELTEIFYNEVAIINPDLAKDFSAYRDTRGVGYADKTESDLIVKMAPYLSKFIARLFEIETEREQLAAATLSQAEVFEFKKNFIQRRVFKKFANQDPESWDFAKLDRAVSHLQQTVFANTIGLDDEWATARIVGTLTNLEKEYGLFLDQNTSQYQIPPNTSPVNWLRRPRTIMILRNCAQSILLFHLKSHSRKSFPDYWNYWNDGHSLNINLRLNESETGCHIASRILLITVIWFRLNAHAPICRN